MLNGCFVPVKCILKLVVSSESLERWLFGRKRLLGQEVCSKRL